MGKASPGKGKYGKNKSVGPSRGKGKPSFRREEGGRSDFVDDETAHAESLKERLMNKQREGGADDAKKAPGPELDDHASKLRKMLMLKKEKQKQAEGGKDTTAKFASAGAAARGAAAMSSIGQNASRKVEMEGSASPSSPVSVNVTEKEKQALRSQRFSTTPGPRKMETQSAKTSPDADLSPGDVVITVDEGARKLEGKGSAVVSVEEPKAATSSSGPAPKPASGEPKAAAAAAPAEASKPAVADPKAVATATPAAPKPAEPKASQAAAPEQPKEAAPPAKPAAAAKAAGGVARSAVVAAAKDAAKSTSVTSAGKAAPKIAEAEAATSSSPAAPKPASVEPKAAGGVARSAVVAAAKDAAKSTYVTSAGQAAPKIAEAEAPKQKPGSAPAASKPPAKPAVQSPPPKNLAPGKAVPPKAVEAKAQQRPISSGEKRKALMMGMLQRQASRRPRPALLVSGGAQALSEVAEEIQFQQKWYNQNRKRWMPYLPEESKKFRPVAPFCMERAKELEDYLRGLGAFKSR